MQTILATTSSFGKSDPHSVELLTMAGYHVETNPYGRKLTEAELLELLQKHAPVGLLAGTEPVSAAVLNAASGYLKSVARVGVGWDNVDHDTANELQISVTRTQGVLDQAVAELTIGMILDALRHISRHDRDIRSGTWEKRMGNLLSGKTVGIIGFGAIGQRVAELCHAFGAEIIFADVTAINIDGYKQLELADLLGTADIITIHASGNACLLNANELAQCKRGVILINTARGGLIDETALATALQEGTVGYAGLDVFEKEPYSGPLADLPNTILTAHIGSYASEARQAMEMAAAKNILASLENAS